MEYTKIRAYCKGTDTVRFDVYNRVNQDPLCSIPYPDDNSGIQDLDLRSFTAKDGECVQVTKDSFFRMDITPNNNAGTNNGVVE